MNSGYSAQLDHLILFFIYNADYFSKLIISFEIFFKQKIGNRNFVCLIENRKYIKLEISPVHLSKFGKPLLNVNEV